jgi:glycosyltransferase involved in cell wall biosynthesis
VAARRITAVTVSYNTVELTALLLWSLHRVLSEPPDEVVVVDNGSDDGSRQLLEGLAAAGRITLLANATNRHHGPALNDAFAFLAARPEPRPDRVWILDSDVVDRRPDTLQHIRIATDTEAAIVGERQHDRWHGTDRFDRCSLVLDPVRTVWNDDVGPFDDGGDPLWPILGRAQRAGLPTEELPFTKDGYVIHRGRGTLAAVLHRQESDHPLFAWAADHHEPHYGGIEGAAERHAELVAAFRGDVPTLTAEALAAALS